jgi:dihydrofolate reductase
MTKVTFDMSMSLDGFITGPHDDLERPLGEGGDRLHEWLYGLESFHERHGRSGGESNRDSEVLDEAFRDVGAILMGRRMFDLAEGPWGDDPPFHNPVFVVTHEAREPLPKEGGTTFTFVTDGIEGALEQARQAAGEKDISIAGGADVVRQYLQAGLIDEFQVHVAPVLLGAGRRLFDNLSGERIELEKTRVIDSPAVTHLSYRIAK